MLLSDGKIEQAIESGGLQIIPLDKGNIQPASIDLTLDRSFLKLRDHSITHIKPGSKLDYIKIEEDTIVIPPHSFILAATAEYIKLPQDLAGIVEGRSSIGRIGLFIQNAGLVSPGFEGNLTLELYNANNMPLQLSSGMRICQLLFMRMEATPSRPYQGRYQKQTSVTGSKILQSDLGVHGGIVEQISDSTISFVDNVKAFVSGPFAKSEKDIKLDTIAIGSDHAGYGLKQKVVEAFKDLKIDFHDFGTNSEKAVDYPLFGQKVAELVSSKKIERGVLICGSGIGMAITANRYKGVRAAVCYDAEMVEKARQHDDINLLVLAGRSNAATEIDQFAKKMIYTFITTKFEGGRHERRLGLIDNN